MKGKSIHSPSLQIRMAHFSETYPSRLTAQWTSAITVWQHNLPRCNGGTDPSRPRGRVIFGEPSALRFQRQLCVWPEQRQQLPWLSLRHFLQMRSRSQNNLWNLLNFRFTSYFSLSPESEENGLITDFRIVFLMPILCALLNSGHLLRDA